MNTKTAHQFAKELLEGPDLPITIPSLFLEDEALTPSVSEVKAEDRFTGEIVTILMISGEISQ